MSCAGIITLHYKFGVAKSLLEDLLPRVGDEYQPARQHMQRVVNALTAPGAHATQDQRVAAESEGYHEIHGVLGNPVHGMPDEEGLGIVLHLKKLGQGDSHARIAAEIAALARKYAVEAVKSDNAAAIKHSGKLIAHLLRAAHEAINVD